MKDTVAAAFNSTAVPTKGHDGNSVCHMKAKRVNIEDWDPLLNEGLKSAKKYIEERL